MSRELAWENSLLNKIDALMEEGLSESQAVSVAVADEIEPDYDEEDHNATTNDQGKGKPNCWYNRQA